MSVFKKLQGGEHSVDPFEANASQSFQWTSGSSDFDGFSIDLALKPPDDYPNGSNSDLPDGTTDLGGTTDGGFNSYPLFQSIKSFFYINSQSFSDTYSFFPDDDVFVINAASGYYGNNIRPNSFKVTIDGTTDFLQDDGSSKLRLNKTGSVLGNVFYQHGVTVIKRDSSAPTSSISLEGIGIVSASVVTTTFLSVMTIYEHNVICTLTPMEFNTTVNPSAFTPSPNDGVTYCDRIASGSEAAPYVSTIGLYNDYNELLAVAKVSSPITRQKYTNQTFLIKFDE